MAYRPRELHLDVETRSALELPDVGAHTYFEHPTTAVWCAAYAFDDEAPSIWKAGDPCPPDIGLHIEMGGVITAWNAAFERLACRHKLPDWPSVNDDQWRCTMTESLGMNMPGMLSKAAPAFGLDIAKDDKGNRLMKQMMRPRKLRKDEIAEPDENGLYWWDDETRRLRLYDYCVQDVRVETAIGKRTLRLMPDEKALYLIDMKINDRGLLIDKALCAKAQALVKQSMLDLDQEMRELSGHEISSCGATAQLRAWLGTRGVVTESVDKEHIEDLLARDDLPDACRRALQIRQEGSKTSTAKLQAMLNRLNHEGRVCGNFQFYGAGQTHRWAGRGVQFQNMTRPVYLIGKGDADSKIKEAINAIHHGDTAMIELVYGQPLTLVADCVRSMVVAAPGKVFTASDLSNIEGRSVAWLAGQEDKLDEFRAFDAGTGPDLYLLAAAGVYNCSLEEALQHRQIGKVCELSLGYQGGPRAFAKMSKTYGVRIADLFDGIWSTTTEDYRDRAWEGWKSRGYTMGLSERGWLAAEVIKLAWRDKNHRISAYWNEVEDAAVTAVANPGEIAHAGVIRFRKVGSFLFCMLPSGSAICYPYPTIKMSKTPWGSSKRSVVYKSMDSYVWQDKGFYGGLGVENITQKFARDVMAEKMPLMEAAGYPIVLHAHDELVSETETGYGSLDEYNAIMAEVPVWAPGLPLSASGWRGTRYRKG